MAARACELGMCAVESKVSVGAVIEAHIRPSQWCVAGIAARAVVAGMNVVGAVTADASGIGRVAAANIDVACRADEAVMPVFERETGLGEVIEARFEPPGRCVAVLASLTISANVHIVDTMTGRAVGLRVDVSLIAVTAAAVGAVMMTDELKLGRAVIELSVGPDGLAMAVVTRLAKIAVVAIVLAMASRAGTIGIAESLFGSVALFAGQARMTFHEGKVRNVVIERVSIEPDDICIAALVLGMAGRALNRCKRLVATVEAFAREQVVVDLGMAVETQSALIFT